ACSPPPGRSSSATSRNRSRPGGHVRGAGIPLGPERLADPEEGDRPEIVVPEIGELEGIDVARAAEDLPRGVIEDVVGVDGHTKRQVRQDLVLDIYRAFDGGAVGVDLAEPEQAVVEWRKKIDAPVQLPLRKILCEVELGIERILARDRAPPAGGRIGDAREAPGRQS